VEAPDAGFDDVGRRRRAVCLVPAGGQLGERELRLLPGSDQCSSGRLQETASPTRSALSRLAMSLSLTGRISCARETISSTASGSQNCTAPGAVPAHLGEDRQGVVGLDAQRGRPTLPRPGVFRQHAFKEGADGFTSIGRPAKRHPRAAPCTRRTRVFLCWESAIRAGLRAMHGRGDLAGDPDDLALATLAALQGGLLPTRLQRQVRPLEVALDAMLDHLESRTRS
jgi:hypothetical protein